LIDRTGPGGDFLSERSAVDGIRGGEWYVSKFGVHDTFEGWEAAGRPMLLEEAREKVEQILATHQPLPLSEDVERELDRIQKRARGRSGD
jgi:trimethylamine--corrinoid protein Co-methyltransferase